MSVIIDMEPLQQIAEAEFSDIVTDTLIPDMNQMRIVLSDSSFIDVWYSLKLANRYSYHWERRAIDGTIYRYDNAPHQRWQNVSTYPHHFHNGQETVVIASDLSPTPHVALRQVLQFARQRLTEKI